MKKTLKWGKNLMFTKYGKSEPPEDASERQKLIYQNELNQIMKNTIIIPMHTEEIRSSYTKKRGRQAFNNEKI